MLYQESVRRHFLSQTGWAPQCKRGPTLDQTQSSASALGGYTPINFTDQDIRITVAAQGGGGACWDTDWVWIMFEKMFKSVLSSKCRAYIRDYCKRNGLLTLSVIAVVTGCVLGFGLRSLNLSTQVWMNGSIWIQRGAMWLDVSLKLMESSGIFDNECKLTQR